MLNALLPVTGDHEGALPIRGIIVSATLSIAAKKVSL